MTYFYGSGFLPSILSTACSRDMHQTFDDKWVQQSHYKSPEIILGHYNIPYISHCQLVASTLLALNIARVGEMCNPHRI